MLPRRNDPPDHPAAVTHGPDARAQTDCLRHLMSLAASASFSVGIGAILVSIWLRDFVPTHVLAPWLAAMLAVAAWRIVLARRLLPLLKEAREMPAARHERHYALLTAITGLLWGLAVWLPMDDPEHTRLFALTAILFCVLLVSSSTLVASRLAFAAFATMLALPLVARLLTLDDQITFLLGGGVLAMCLLALTSFRVHHRTLVTALHNRLQSEDLLQQQRVIFESAGEGIVLLHPKPDYVVDCNRRFAELLGYPLDAMRGMAPWHWHPDREQWKRLVADSLPVIARGHPYQQALQLRRADDTLFWGEVTGMAVDPDNLRAGTVWIVSDVTAKRAAEAALAVSEARFRDLVRLSSDLYWEQDAQFRYTHFDGSPEIMANIPIDQLIGRTRWEIAGLVGVPEARWKEHIETLNRHEPFRDFIYQLGSHSGRVLWYSISGNPMFDADGQFVGYHGTASDITSRLETEARFRHLAYHDSLTGLPNRRLLEDRIGQAIRTARREEGQLALLLIDLDRFKPINDTFGHAIGDRVLEATGERLRNCVRAADTVARIGGDEFVVLLTAVSTTGDALQVAEKIIARIAEPIDIDGQRHQIGGSVGISLYPAHGGSAEDLLQHADQAMYQGKQQGGRTATIYTPSGTT
jgi:diguanylate cyclase (GGDEF)-like protein/PAS domain S-box-containing protein